MDKELYERELQKAIRSKKQQRLWLLLLIPLVGVILLISSVKNRPAEVKYEILRIESNTTWSGFIDGRSIDGKGNRDLEVTWYGQSCYTLQKQTESGFLKIGLHDNKDNLVAGENVTSARFGLVQICR
jgi:hypothetical protein